MSADGDEAGPSSGSHSHRINRLPMQITTSMQGINCTAEDKNNDYLCPICFDIIEEAHVTRCGHTFCYKCILRSIETLGRCPKCNINLTQQDIFPNFLLNELIAKNQNYAKGIAFSQNLDNRSKAPFFTLDSAVGISDSVKNFIVSDNANLSLPDVNAMLEVLTQRKHLLEAESCAAQNRLLYEFLKHLLIQKEEQKNQLQKEVTLIKRDMKDVEIILKDLQKKCPRLEDVNKSTEYDTAQVTAIRKEMINLINIIDSSTIKSCEETDQIPNTFSMPNNQNNYDIACGSALAIRRRRMHAHFDDFVHCYFNARAKELHFGSDKSLVEITTSGLDVFREDLVKFSRYNSLRPLASLNYSSDIFNHSTIVSSIEFDKDNEYFAIAGVTKRIKVFDYNTVIRGTVDLHYPTVEMTSSSKISCVSWNSFHKATLASSDYEGTVTIWDAMTGQRTKAFHEHEKRCWSIDFNDVDTRLIASGSDDARVKLWSLNMDHSVASLEAKANVCCVKFNPRSSCHLAFGSADHCVHYYDLRNMKEALCVFKGHKKAVSYVKFVNDQEIVSASTDSQLKMWNINNPYCLRSFVGHVNEKNFVGLATDGDYVACGSENNALYIYYKGLTKQLFSYKFDAAKSILETQEKRDEDLNEFVSAVCWRKMSNVVVAANSQGERDKFGGYERASRSNFNSIRNSDTNGGYGGNNQQSKVYNSPSFSGSIGEDNGKNRYGSENKKSTNNFWKGLGGVSDSHIQGSNNFGNFFPAFGNRDNVGGYSSGNHGKDMSSFGSSSPDPNYFPDGTRSTPDISANSYSPLDPHRSSFEESNSHILPRMNHAPPFESNSFGGDSYSSNSESHRGNSGPYPGALSFFSADNDHSNSMNSNNVWNFRNSPPFEQENKQSNEFSGNYYKN